MRAPPIYAYDDPRHRPPTGTRTARQPTAAIRLYAYDARLRIAGREVPRASVLTADARRQSATAPGHIYRYDRAAGGETLASNTTTTTARWFIAPNSGAVTGPIYGQSATRLMAEGGAPIQMAPFVFTDKRIIYNQGDFALSATQSDWQQLKEAFSSGQNFARLADNLMQQTRGVGLGGMAIEGEVTTVIGRVKDLQNLGAGEKSLLGQLRDLLSPKANWEQNSSVLRQEMNRGLPIRDASPGDIGGQFTNAERNLLQNRGWTFDPTTNRWMPPQG